MVSPNCQTARRKKKLHAEFDILAIGGVAQAAQIEGHLASHKTPSRSTAPPPESTLCGVAKLRSGSITAP